MLQCSEFKDKKSKERNDRMKKVLMMLALMSVVFAGCIGSRPAYTGVYNPGGFLNPDAVILINNERSLLIDLSMNGQPTAKNLKPGDEFTFAPNSFYFSAVVVKFHDEQGSYAGAVTAPVSPYRRGVRAYRVTRYGFYGSNYYGGYY